MHDKAAMAIRDIGQAMPSQRELFQYIEHAKIRVDEHRVVAWSRDASGSRELARSIPYCNTAFLLLGPGCSISTEAVELLSAANVVIGFTGALSTPLHSGVEPITFSVTQSEYRPTETMQAWASWWFTEEKRIEKARELLLWRAEMIEKVWPSSRMNKLLTELGVKPVDSAAFFAQHVERKDDPLALLGLCSSGSGATAKEYFERKLHASSITAMLGNEGAHVKNVYRFWAQHVGTDFSGRDPEAKDVINVLLTMGNYIAYGLAATALHGLGVSFAFPLLHGKTRRGALVFDIADPIKDAVVVPLAFACATAGCDSGFFRRTIKAFLEDEKILAITMKKIKDLAHS